MMRIRLVGALATGFLAALGAASFPASAADTSIATQPNDTWNPSSVTIKVGDTVTWSNADGGFHNVCVQKPGTTSTTCDEFRNGDPAPTWAANPTNAHKFTAPGTYSFYCEAHKSLGMTGTITVEGDTTGTTVPPDTQPTDTTTAPTQTAPASDTTAPSFVGKLKRRSSRKSLILELGSSEDATLEATVFRRAPHGGSFGRVGQASLKVEQGRNVVTLPRKAGGSLRSGSYMLKLRLADAAGNRSAPKTLRFKIS